MSQLRSTYKCDNYHNLAFAKYDGQPFTYIRDIGGNLPRKMGKLHRIRMADGVSFYARTDEVMEAEE